MNTIIKTTLTALGTLLLAGALNAQTALSFGGDYVAANEANNPLRAWSTVADPVFPNIAESLLTLDDANPISTVAGNIYGMGYVENGDGGGFFKINEGGANDPLVMDSATFRGANTQTALVAYWQKADFINGFDAAAVDLTTPGAKVEFTYNSAAFSTDPGAYLMIKTGSDWFVNTERLGVEATGVYYTATYTDAGLASSTWAAYDPSTAVFVDPGTAATGTPDLTDLTAVGIYGSGINAAGAGTGNRVQWRTDSFTVVVPEPSTYAIMLGGLALGFVMWRRRRA